MTCTPSRPPYEVRLDELERGVRVPPDQQVETVDADPGEGSEWADDEERRHLRLVGGA